MPKHVKSTYLLGDHCMSKTMIDTKNTKKTQILLKLYSKFSKKTIIETQSVIDTVIEQQERQEGTTHFIGWKGRDWI